MIIKPKEKPCKAIGKAKSSDVQGCGKPVYKRTYGLCDNCYREWLFETPEGKEKQQHALPKCKNCGERFTPFHNNSLQKYCVEHIECITAQVGHAKEQEIKRLDKVKQQFRIDDMSANKYREVKLQPHMNHIARLIDKGQACIANPERYTGKMNGGHRHSVGSNSTLALNIHNIHIQSYESNDKQGGDHVKYRAGIKLIYSAEYADFIDETLMQCPPLHLTKEDLVELRPKIIEIEKRLKKLDLVYTPKQRIRLRNQVNLEIGIYSDEFAVFGL